MQTKWVVVQFAGSSRHYSYIYHLKKSVKKGDYLVVNSPYGGYKVVKCIKVKHSNPPEIATKCILEKLDI